MLLSQLEIFQHRKGQGKGNILQAQDDRFELYKVLL